MILSSYTKPVFTDFSIEDAEEWRLHDPVVDRDLKYFEGCTGGTRMPRRADVKPGDLKSALPEIAMVEPIYDAAGVVVDVKGLLEGTRLDSLYGPMTGILISEYSNKVVGDRIIQACKYCVEVAKPIVVIADALSEQKDFLAITVLYVPMSEDGALIDRIFIHNQVKSKHSGR